MPAPPFASVGTPFSPLGTGHLAKSWEEIRVNLLPADASPKAVESARRAFYYGALTMAIPVFYPDPSTTETRENLAWELGLFNGQCGFRPVVPRD